MLKKTIDASQIMRDIHQQIIPTNKKLITPVSDDVFFGSGWLPNERGSSDVWKWMSHMVSYIYVNNQQRNIQNITLELSNSYPRSGNDPISFCVFLNKKYCYDVEIVNLGIKIIKIDEMPDADVIEIKLYVDKLWRPSDCGIADGDHRLLGLALTNITAFRKKNDVVSEGCEDVTVISDDVFFGAGWLGNERDFPELWKWNCSPKSCIYVNNQYKNLQGVVLELANTCPGSATDPVSCSVVVNKKHFCNIEIKNTGMQRIEIDKMPDADLIEIELLVNKLWRPCDYENCGDSRLLGLAVKNLEVSRGSAHPVSENEEKSASVDNKDDIIFNNIIITQSIDFVDSRMQYLQDHLDVGVKLPVFSRFNILTKKFLVLFTRFVRKVCLFFTKEQSLINHEISDCLKSLVDGIHSATSNLDVLYNNDKEISRSVVKLEEQFISFKEQFVALDYRYEREREENEILRIQTALLKARYNKILLKREALERRIEEMRAAQESAAEGARSGEERLEKLQNAFPAEEMYVRFEDRFRGSREEIARRIKYYLDNYISWNVKKTQDNLIIDLGCGRGEWLGQLRENGYFARGVDFNGAMVQLCRGYGFDVVESDAIAFLNSLDSNSVKAVTSFQMIEHLQLGQITALLKESFRILKKEGVIILETPNSNNIEVGSSAFYIDPTHKRPIHQEYMSFLAKEIGFRKTEIAYWKDKEISDWIDSVIDADREMFDKSAVLRTLMESAKRSMYTPPDYALIAIK
jgi:O-antigen chain-terminating methyltransferase